MNRTSAAYLLLGTLPILAQEDPVDPYEDLPDYYPQYYRSLADVPEKYHDGEKLTGCYFGDSVLDNYFFHGPPPEEEDIKCYNPFYWDEHGRIKRRHYAGNPADVPPPEAVRLGATPREPQPAPCDGCLSSEQALDIFRVYHRELGIKPLGEITSIVRGYPWNGRGNPYCEKYDPNYLDALYPNPRDPHPHERVNMKRIRWPLMGFNELCDAVRDPQNRDLTWRVRFQFGWHDPAKRTLDEHSQHWRNWPRTPCTAVYYIHARTGEMRTRAHYHKHFETGKNPAKHCTGETVANVNLLTNLGEQAWKAYYEMHQRLFLYLPDSTRRNDSWLDYGTAKGLIELYERDLRREAERQREAEEREGKEQNRRVREIERIWSPPKNLREAGNADPGTAALLNASSSGSQHILVYWGDNPVADLINVEKCNQQDDPETEDVDESKLHEPKCKARVPKIRQCDEDNIPLSEIAKVSEDKTYDCILWTRLHGKEKCWYTNSKGRRYKRWCARRSYEEKGGFTSKDIRRQIAAVESLTAHRVGWSMTIPISASRRTG